MRYTAIPNTDLTPSAICLGSVDLGAVIDRATSFAMLDRFLELGGTFIDTAKVYSDWIPGETSRSEKVLGAWLREHSKREKVILATKGAHPDLKSMGTPRMSPQEIIGDLEDSLRHLQTDTIDLYWLHRDDPATPIETIIDTLHQQVQAGKIRYYGCSNWQVERIKAAQAYAAAEGISGFVGVQNLWNLADVNKTSIGDPTLVVMDDGLWKYHREANLAAIPFTSQANGLFQKMDSSQPEAVPPKLLAMYMNPVTERRYERLKSLCTRTGLSTTQVVLGYLSSQPFPTIPVVGPHSMAQLEDCLTAADVMLTPEQLNFLIG